jgi:hypothetical protein
MKILLFDFGYFGSPHLETEAEIIQRHLDQGDKVLRLACRRDLPVCLANPEHHLTRCAVCLCRRKTAMRLVSPSVREKSVINLTAHDQETIATFRFQGKRLTDLKELMFGSFDIGLAVASVLVDETKNPDPDLAMMRQRVDDWIGVSLAAYLSTLNTLEAEKPDRVYVMNGRWSYARAVLRACQLKGVECHLHERGGDLNRYIVVVNRLPHEIAGSVASIEDLWRMGEVEAREAIGATFFEEKAKGIERQWFSFVAEQKQNQLPAEWDPARRNIAVFTTSEFEHAAIGPDYTYRFYKDQSDALARIVAALEAMDTPVHLNIRIHPNMKGVRNENLDRLLSLQSPFATIIPPESPVSTYALLRACEKTLTFGSTMGIEAVYWGKPSILAGPATYAKLGGTYNPSTHEELISMLAASLEPMPREAALKFGYHVLRVGIEHKYYQPETAFRGRFKGHDLDESASLGWRLIRYFAKKQKVRIALTWLSRAHRLLMRRRLGIRS